MTAMYACPRPKCREVSLLFFQIGVGDGQVELTGSIPRGRAAKMAGLPEEIEDVRQEAWSCYHGGDHRAALVIGRAAVQRGVRVLGGTGRDLFSEIESLVEKGVVLAPLKEAAHRVRLSAREAAHPEELGHVTEEEARTSLEFADAFLEFAIALPERLKTTAEEADAARERS